VAYWPAWWDLLSRHREVLVVEGQRVAIPDRVGCALIAGLHASKATQQEKALEDLRRAIQIFDDEVWHQAAGLAQSVGAAAAFAAALCRLSAGAELATRLGLTVTDPVVWFGATSLKRGAGCLSLVLEPGPWTVRARRLRDAAFPSRAMLAPRRPIARRGGGGLAVAHLDRLVFILTRLPQLLLAWFATSRALRRHGAATSHALVPLRPRRTLRVRAKVVVGTSWWTLQTWWHVHRWLARGERGNGALPAIAVPAGSGTAHSRRVACFVLACCRSTCLESAFVRQARAASTGIAIDVVVGVAAPASGFRAHAWLDGDRVEAEFGELWRYPAMVGPDWSRRAG